MTQFLLLACQILGSADSLGALRRVAAKALIVAIDEGLVLPTEAPGLLWAHAKAHDPSFLRLRGLGKVLDPALAADVFATLIDPAAGDLLRDGAASIVATPEAARFVADADLNAIISAAQDAESAARAAQIIVARHEVCPVNVETLVRFRDIIYRNADGRVRRVALVLDAEIPGSDAGFLRALIADQDAEVRIAAANEADWLAKDLEDGWALATLNEAIARERYPAALVALLRARLYVWEIEGMPESLEAGDPAFAF